MASPALITRIGAKNGKSGQLIAKSLWREGIDTYIEPFGGSWGVGRQAAPYPKEIYAELDYMVYTAVKMFAKHGAAILYYILENFPYSQEVFDRLRGELIASEKFFGERLEQDMGASDALYADPSNHLITDEVQRGAMALALSVMSANGNFKLFKDDKGSSPRLFQERIRSKRVLAERYSGLDCKYMNGFDLVKQYKYNEHTMMVIDPPYLHAEDSTGRTSGRTSGKGLYKHDLSTPEGHLELLEVLVNSRAKLLLCSYRNTLYDSFFADRHNWHTYDLCRTKKSMFIGTLGHRKPDAIETVYTNYEIGGDWGRRA
jgi:site-specific DNA-adenine methylase